MVITLTAVQATVHNTAEMAQGVDLIGAAFQSRLSHNKFSSLEENLFPEIANGPSEVKKAFLQIRNRILQKWLDNPKVELIYEMAIQNMADSQHLFPTYLQLSLHIHKYLEMHGYINFGLFKRIHPIRKIKKGKVIVVGAGIAGLAAARQLQSFGMDVVIVEARDRVGGRISTFRKGKYIADLGAMVVTGLGGNPITVISKQINMELHKIKQDCPLYETGGLRVPKEKDVLVEQEFNKLLEATSYLSNELHVDSFKDKQLSLGQAFELIIQIQEKKVKEQLIAHEQQIYDRHQQLLKVLQRINELQENALEIQKELANSSDDTSDDIKKTFAKKLKLKKWKDMCKEFDELSKKRSNLESEIVVLEYHQPSDVYLSSKDRQLLDWHIANLEFANATPLHKLSLKHWNQDDAYEFSGSHLVVRNGYSTLPNAYADSLNIRLNSAVRKIVYKDQGCQVVVQSTQVNSPPVTMECDVVLCTLPLGVLRPPDPQLDHGPSITFEPPLPEWKTEAINRMGFGNLNKVVLSFEHAFWDPSASNLFGHIGSTTSSRGELFLFWAIYRAPVLIALVAGEAANVMEHVGDGVVISRTLAVLKGIFGADNVPDPLSYTVTRWGSEPWSRGSYSYVATGSTGDDYDIMAAPVNAQGSPMSECEKNNPVLFFAGEHTMRNYPATVHGALLSGFREAARIAEIFLGPANSPPDDITAQLKKD